MRLLRSIGLIALLLAAIIPGRGLADVPNVTASGTLSTTGLGKILHLDGHSVCTVVVSGTYTGLTLQFVVTPNTGVFSTGPLFSPAGGGTGVSSVSSNGTWIGNVAGYTQFAVNVSAIATGSVSYTETCTGQTGLGSSASGGSSGAPLTGGSSAVATGANQSVGVHGYNGSTLDALRASGHTGQAGASALSNGVLNVNGLSHCIYNTTPITPTSGNLYPLQCDNVASIKVNCVSGCSVISAWSYAIITTSGGTTVKGSPGTFAGIVNLSTASQPAGLCTIYDNTASSGNIMYQENGIAPNQVIMLTNNGIAANTGITINCATAPTTGLMVLFK